MFEGDRYLIHVEGGETALAALSGVLVFLAVAAVRVARRWVRVAAAVPALGFVFWWIFVWLTPQAYYLLYALLAEGLPFRLVVGSPPGPERLVSLLTFRGHASAADLALGVLGWAMIAAAIPRA